MLANRLTHELVLEPASEEDIEGELAETEPGRLTSTAQLDGYRLIVQAKLCSGDAEWPQLVLSYPSTLAREAEKRTNEPLRKSVAREFTLRG